MKPERTKKSVTPTWSSHQISSGPQTSAETGWWWKKMKKAASARTPVSAGIRAPWGMGLSAAPGGADGPAASWGTGGEPLNDPGSYTRFGRELARSRGERTPGLGESAPGGSRFAGGGVRPGGGNPAVRGQEPDDHQGGGHRPIELA